MAFAHLSYCESLRIIATRLGGGQSAILYHIWILLTNKVPGPSRAKETRERPIYAAFAINLNRQARKLYFSNILLIELTMKPSAAGCEFYEVPISYYGRNYAEGKKIRWHDGFRAIWFIFHYWVVAHAMKSKLPNVEEMRIRNTSNSS